MAANPFSQNGHESNPDLPADQLIRNSEFLQKYSQFLREQSQHLSEHGRLLAEQSQQLRMHSQSLKEQRRLYFNGNAKEKESRGDLVSLTETPQPTSVEIPPSD